MSDQVREAVGAAGSAIAELRAVPPRSASDEVTTQLLDLIQRGVFRPGDRLPSETELARILQVGRSTVREAKRELLARGFLESRGKRGTHVATPSPEALDLEMLGMLLQDEHIREIHEVRQIVEGGAVRLAARRATQEDFDALERILEDMARDLSDDERFWPRTVEFHRRLVEACHNRTLASLFQVVSRLMAAQQMPVYRSMSKKREVIDLHRRLADALRQGEEAAVAEVTSHLEESDRKRERALRDRRRR
jgi:GntR family transcriptional regulator, transcriptional repressor for pyruvate dehydrogenase complex